MASERHKTWQKCKRGEHRIERKMKGGEEALCKSSWRKRNPFTASGGLCWLPPALSSESTQVLGLLVTWWHRWWITCCSQQWPVISRWEPRPRQGSFGGRRSVVQMHLAKGDGWNISCQRCEVCYIPKSRLCRSVKTQVGYTTCLQQVYEAH